MLVHTVSSVGVALATAPWGSIVKWKTRGNVYVRSSTTSASRKPCSMLPCSSVTRAQMFVAGTVRHRPCRPSGGGVSCTRGAVGSSARSTSTTGGSGSYRTSTSRAARTAVGRSSATTTATGSPS